MTNEEYKTVIRRKGKERKGLEHHLSTDDDNKEEEIVSRGPPTEELRLVALKSTATLFICVSV